MNTELTVSRTATCVLPPIVEVRPLYRLGMADRWDGDDRGRGVADAGQLVPGAGELLAALRERDWVAEDPDLHLRPHVEEWCRQDGRFAVLSDRTDEAHAYVLDLEWRGAPAGVGAVRAAAFALTGSFAESATYIRQRRFEPSADAEGLSLRFEIGTGELASDASFEPHGQVVFINVTVPGR